MSISKKKGDTLLREKHFVFALFKEMRSIMCNSCLSVCCVKKCSKCSYVYYCSKECQKEAWPLHKYECDKLRDISPKNVDTQAHLMARIYLKLQKCGGKEKFYYYGNKCTTFNDLVSRTEEIRKDGYPLLDFQKLLCMLRDFLKKPLNEALLFEIYGKVCMNSCSIVAPNFDYLGVGIYLGVSTLNHSCYPTAIAVFHGTELEICVIKDIDDFQWEKVTISYIELLGPPKERREELQQRYYITCECSRCLDKEEENKMLSMQCPNMECTQNIPVLDENVPYQCSACGTAIPEDRVTSFRDVTEKSKKCLNNLKLIESRTERFALSQEVLKSQEGLLHPLNVYKLRVTMEACHEALRLFNWSPALFNYCMDLIPKLKTYYGEHHHDLTMLYFEVTRLMFLLNINIEEEFFEQALKHMIVTHEKQHVLYRRLELSCTTDTDSSS